MKKILFVCHGNICRSPMAEFVFKKIVADNGASDRYFVESRATSAEELGNPVYPPAKRELLKHGITCDGKTAIRLTRADYDKYDLIIGMDERNIRNMLLLFGSDPEGKIRKMMTFAGQSADVADPWYSGEFDVTYRDVLVACEALFALLKK